MKRTTSFISLAILILFLFSSAAVLQAANKPWTIMVYMGGDNDSTMDNQTQIDLNRFETAGSNADRNIVALCDRLDDGIKIYYIDKDDNDGQVVSKVVKEIPEASTGDPKILTDFFKYCAENYPADNYLLDLWNHGGGIDDPRRAERASKGIIYDGSDCIAMVELKAAMAEGKTTFGKNIAVVEMDACLMGLFEVAYQIKDSCDFVSFSEEVEPMDGIPYKAILPQIVAATT
ncbi:MAG: clostripain-related cysteine peptidase, partial [Candidatus Wallbacteria bacterium]|nr:clostripain-related cysteine peptidase [Candidatus Wallbacteria bacterium]